MLRSAPASQSPVVTIPGWLYSCLTSKFHLALSALFMSVHALDTTTAQSTVASQGTGACREGADNGAPLDNPPCNGAPLDHGPAPSRAATAKSRVSAAPPPFIRVHEYEETRRNTEAARRSRTRTQKPHAEAARRSRTQTFALRCLAGARTAHAGVVVRGFKGPPAPAAVGPVA